jgi:hypothetical protein
LISTQKEYIFVQLFIQRTEGYAYSGAGNGITRVDISVDGGQTWTQTEIYNENDPYTQKR